MYCFHFNVTTYDVEDNFVFLKKIQLFLDSRKLAMKQKVQKRFTAKLIQKR